MTANDRLGIGFAGRIGSGKTFAAMYLAERWGFQYLRYSQVLAEWFRTDPDAKNALQDFGWNVMSGENQHRLNELLIARIDPNQDCSIDGLRHTIDYEELKARFGPSSFSLIFVDTDTATRFQRLRSRFDSYESFEAADSHPVEHNINSLRSLADIVISGDLATRELKQALDQFIGPLMLRRKS